MCCFRRAIAILLCLTSHALANGFEIPEQGARSLARGGAFSAKADDPTATVHNPGAVSKLRGTHIMYSHNLFWSFSEFTRSESSIEGRSNSSLEGHDRRFDTSENEKPFFPLALSLAATSDFGLENMSFGFSLLGPNSSGNVRFPKDGGQRYLLTELDVLLIYYGLTMAYGTETWGIGATVQWVHLPYLKFSLVVDASINPDINPYASDFDVHASVEAKDTFTPSALLGAWFRPIPELELAISGRPFPIRLETRGKPIIDTIPGTIPDLTNLDLTVQGGHLALDLDLPRTARFGIRYRHLQGKTETFDIELDVVWEGWSSLDKYGTRINGEVELFGAQQTINNVVVEKNWQDSLSIRLGGTYVVSPDVLSVSAGGFWEQAAAPTGYSHLDFPAGERMGLALGMTYTMDLSESSQLDLSIAYNYTDHKAINVSEEESRVIQQRPLTPCNIEGNCDPADGVTVNAGKFKTVYQQVGLAATVRF
ncbi:MAG: hypothetical protein CMH52_01385 [Myxococcales bacterium]|nr:hypothetical protein [Myxococcales bacterium]